MEPAPAAITRLLHQSQQGNKAAFDELMPVVYEQLYRLAGRRLASERRGHTLRTTEIVHEAYLRLVDSDIAWNDRAHFYAIASQVMRRILVDYAKSRNREKRGGEYERVPLDAAFDVGAPSSSNLIEVNQAARAAFCKRCPKRHNHRTARLRRPHLRGSGGDSRNLRGHSSSRVKTRQSLALP